MRNRDTDTNPLVEQITQFKAELGTQFGKIKGYFSSTLVGNGGRMDSVADSILQGIKDGYTTETVAKMSFTTLQECRKILDRLDQNTDMEFSKKQEEREQIYAILTHIDNVNRKIPRNAADLKATVQTAQMDEIWEDIDQIREDQQSNNWLNLKRALMVLVCALIIAVFIGAMVTGWPAVGAFIIGAIVHAIFPQLTQIISAMVVAAVTVGLWKNLRPIDKYAAETQLSVLTEKEIEEQQRQSMDELGKFNADKEQDKPKKNKEANRNLSTRPSRSQNKENDPRLNRRPSSNQSQLGSGPKVVAKDQPEGRVWSGYDSGDETDSLIGSRSSSKGTVIQKSNAPIRQSELSRLPSEHPQHSSRREPSSQGMTPGRPTQSYSSQTGLYSQRNGSDTDQHHGRKYRNSNSDRSQDNVKPTQTSKSRLRSTLQRDEDKDPNQSKHRRF